MAVPQKAAIAVSCEVHNAVMRVQQGSPQITEGGEDLKGDRSACLALDQAETIGLALMLRVARIA